MRYTLALALLALSCNGEENPPVTHTYPPAGDSHTLAGDDTPGGDTFRHWEMTGFNNGEVISGATFPNGTDANNLLRRSVPVVLNGADFSAADATISRSRVDTNPDTTVIYAMMPVTNVSDRPYCFIAVGEARYLNATSATVASVSFRDVSGSVGKSGSVFTPTCLAPGETGYFCDVQLGDLYEVIASIELDIVPDPDEAIADPRAYVRATGYSFDGGNTLTVQITNEGDLPARLYDNSSFFILLESAAGPPLWWHLLDTPASPSDLVVPAGGNATLVDADVHFNGTGAAIQMFFDWADDS